MHGLTVSLLSESFFAKNTPGVFVCVFRAVSIQLPSLPSSCVKGRGNSGLNWVKPRVQWAAGLCLYLPTLAPVRTVPGSGPLGDSRNFLDTNNSEFPCCMRQRTLVSGLNFLLLCPAPTTSNIGFLHLSPVNLSKQTNNKKQNQTEHQRPQQQKQTQNQIFISWPQRHVSSVHWPQSQKKTKRGFGIFHGIADTVRGMCCFWDLSHVPYETSVLTYCDPISSQAITFRSDLAPGQALLCYENPTWKPRVYVPPLGLGSVAQNMSVAQGVLLPSHSLTWANPAVTLSICTVYPSSLAVVLQAGPKRDPPCPGPSHSSLGQKDHQQLQRFLSQNHTKDTTL